jgi:hypothetical protein
MVHDENHVCANFLFKMLCNLITVPRALPSHGRKRETGVILARLALEFFEITLEIVAVECVLGRLPSPRVWILELDLWCVVLGK